MCTHGSRVIFGTWHGCNFNISTELENSTPDVCRASQHGQVLVEGLSLRNASSITPGGGPRQGSNETLLVSRGVF